MHGLSRRRRVAAGLAALALTGLPSCNYEEEARAAQRAAAGFHRQLDAAEFAAIYWGGHDDLKAVASEADFVGLLDAIHRKLGKITTTTLTASNVRKSIDATDIQLAYRTEFADGPATEHFVYRMDAGRPLLLGYKIDSLALITK